MRTRSFILHSWNYTGWHCLGMHPVRGESGLPTSAKSAGRPACDTTTFALWHLLLRFCDSTTLRLYATWHYACLSSCDFTPLRLLLAPQVLRLYDSTTLRLLTKRCRPRFCDSTTLAQTVHLWILRLYDYWRASRTICKLFQKV